METGDRRHAQNVELKVTADGSHTLYVPGLDEHYHSVFGAIGESAHIFIGAGLAPLSKVQKRISIFEVGFGTGLNAFLTCLHAAQNGLSIRYSSIEKYPLSNEMASRFNFPEEMTAHIEYQGEISSLDFNAIFQKLHQCSWNEWQEITGNFQLNKINEDLLEFDFGMEGIDLVYFDAFGPDVQPEMWSGEIFGKISRCMNPGGILVTYSTKGEVKRNLKAAGFSIEKLPGPPGKREILRAWLV